MMWIIVAIFLYQGEVLGPYALAEKPDAKVPDRFPSQKACEAQLKEYAKKLEEMKAEKGIEFEYRLSCMNEGKPVDLRGS